MLLLKTRALTEGAMLSAILVILAILSRYFSFFMFIISVPLALFVYRNGPKNGILMVLISATITALLARSIFLALDIIVWGILGFALGISLKEKFTASQVFFVGVIAAIIAIFIWFYAYSAIMGLNIVEQFVSAWETTSEQFMGIFSDSGISEEQMNLYTEIFTNMPDLMQTYLPLMLVFGGILMTGISLVVIRAIIKRLGEEVPAIPKFIHWRFPWYLIWGPITAQVLLLVAPILPSEFLAEIALNINAFFLYVYMIQGLAIGWFYIDKFQVPRLVRILIIVFLFTTGAFLLLALALIGILDAWLDFRKLKSMEVE